MIRRILTLRGIVTLIGAALIGTAILVVLKPGFLQLQSLDALFPSDETRRYVEVGSIILFAIFIGFLALFKALLGGQERSRAPIDPEPRGVRAGDEAILGAVFDSQLAKAVTENSSKQTERSREQVKEELRSTIARASITFRDHSKADAETLVSTGGWTDDRVVAAFLGDERAPTMPFRERVSKWLYPEDTFDRMVERTIDQIHDQFPVAAPEPTADERMVMDAPPVPGQEA